jgi:hypothetical protein
VNVTCGEVLAEEVDDHCATPQIMLPNPVVKTSMERVRGYTLITLSIGGDGV